MSSFLPSVLILGLAALAALFLGVTRQSCSHQVAERSSAARMMATATGIQCIHFLEEAILGFPVEFPALFGLPEMSLYLFVSFNLMCLGIWAVSIDGLRRAHRGAFVAAWFLAIAGTLNGLAHPLMALSAGGYFPGLATSPLIGGAGLLVWRSLLRATTRVRPKPKTPSTH